eukprot:1145822-Pelagomonas_calceolata.AAC.5
MVRAAASTFPELFCSVLQLCCKRLPLRMVWQQKTVRVVARCHLEMTMRNFSGSSSGLFRLPQRMVWWQQRWQA